MVFIRTDLRSVHAALVITIRKSKKRRSDMALRLKENISWVGKVDWELKTFHGKEFRRIAVPATIRTWFARPTRS